MSRKANETYSKHRGLFINTYHESRKEAVQLRTQILSLRLHLWGQPTVNQAQPQNTKWKIPEIESSHFKMHAFLCTMIKSLNYLLRRFCFCLAFLWYKPAALPPFLISFGNSTILLSSKPQTQGYDANNTSEHRTRKDSLPLYCTVIRAGHGEIHSVISWVVCLNWWPTGRGPEMYYCW